MQLPSAVPRIRPWALAVAGSLAVGALAACGSADTASACGPLRREALDPAYLVHVLDDGTDVAYTSDPPTSGPHKPGPELPEVLEDPLAPSLQVGLLEQGDVLLQYRPSLPADEVRALRGLASDRVTVAPAPDLPDAVVATAWVHKQTCDRVDLPTLRAFVDERVGKGPKG